LHYEGSLTVSSDLAELVELREYEKILVGNLSNGERFETYVIYGEPQKSLIELKARRASRENWRPHYDHEFRELFGG
jgi:aspartate 1-decarboxylase